MYCYLAAQVNNHLDGVFAIIDSNLVLGELIHLVLVFIQSYLEFYIYGAVVALIGRNNIGLQMDEHSRYFLLLM